MRPVFLFRSSDGGKLKGNGDERKFSEDTISKARTFSPTTLTSNKNRSDKVHVRTTFGYLK